MNNRILDVYRSETDTIQVKQWEEKSFCWTFQSRTVKMKNKRTAGAQSVARADAEIEKCATLHFILYVKA